MKGKTLLMVVVALFVVYGQSLGQTSINWICHPVHFAITGDGKLLEKFEKETGIKVVVHKYGHEVLREKIAMELAARSGKFDVISMYTPYWRTDLGGNVFVDLRERAEKLPDFNDYLPGAIKGFKADDGALVALPIRSGTFALTYRSDLLKEAGLSVPKTMEELRSAAIKLTKNGVYGLTFDGKQGVSMTNMFECYLYMFGARIIDYEKNKCVINSKEGVQAAEFLVKLWREDKVFPPGMLTYDHQDSKTMIQEGKVAMGMMWWPYVIWFNDPAKSQVAGKVKIAVIPQAPGIKEPRNAGGFWGLFIDKNSKDIDAAWRFITFITNKESDLFMAENGNGPIRISTFNSPKLAKMYYGADHAEVGREASKLAVPIRPVPGISQAWDIIAIELGNAFTGKKTAKQAMDDTAKSVDEVIAR